jgi:hypothetical protein
MNSARHVNKLIMNLRFMSYMASDDVASTIHENPAVLNPIFASDALHCSVRMARQLICLVMWPYQCSLLW